MSGRIEPWQLIGKTVKLVDGELVIDGCVVTSRNHQGWCCGYAGSSIKHFADGIITDVRTEDRYDDDDDGYGTGVVITVFHEDQTLASLEAVAGSGSGWAYGAVSRILIGDDTLLRVEF